MVMFLKQCKRCSGDLIKNLDGEIICLQCGSETKTDGK
jgi:uncharacterized Zn finger protein (UPF0148 family)